MNSAGEEDEDSEQVDYGEDTTSSSGGENDMSLNGQARSTTWRRMLCSRCIPADRLPGSRDSGNRESRFGRDPGIRESRFGRDPGIRGIGNPDLAGIGKLNPDARASGIWGSGFGHGFHVTGDMARSDL